jgi:hypothetical protein
MWTVGRASNAGLSDESNHLIAKVDMERFLSLHEFYVQQLHEFLKLNRVLRNRIRDVVKEQLEDVRDA